MIRTKKIAPLTFNADHPGGWAVLVTVPAGVRYKLDELRFYFAGVGGNNTCLFRITDGTTSELFAGSGAEVQNVITPVPLAVVAEPGDNIEVLCAAGASLFGQIAGIELEL